jgi:hypothetical protein
MTNRVSSTPYFWCLSGLAPVGKRVRPNPSIERTSTGLAHSTPQVYSPFRGPSRWRPAHVKR